MGFFLGGGGELGYAKISNVFWACLVHISEGYGGVSYQ